MATTLHIQQGDDSITFRVEQRYGLLQRILAGVIAAVVSAAFFNLYITRPWWISASLIVGALAYATKTHTKRPALELRVSNSRP